ncbi:MAG: outer membrane protein assembly factor BamA [Bacteriovoracaceae bacterium]|jgi:outer membrane protein insertion porin family|nr:outer membrane protein assembly factor BamA [Bacteriovoracaceae bacterium]
MLGRYIFLIVLILGSFNASAKKLFKINKVVVEGTKRVEPQAILEKVFSKKGIMLDTEILKSDIKKIYEMKYFDLVEAHRRSNSLVFKVKEKSVVSKIVFEGNDEVSDDDINEKIKTKPFNILDVNSIKEDVQIIQKLYEEKGYYLAVINYDLRKNEFGNLDLTFKIQEFDKVRVKKIYFLGNNEVKDDELKPFMQTTEESFFSGMSDSGSFKEFNFQTDIERLKYLYKTKGYLQVNIGNPEVTVSEDKKWIFITIKIQEGPKFSVNDIFYNGELLFTGAELDEKTSLKSGDIYSEEKLRRDIQSLTEMYQDKGYAFANVLRNLQIVPGENKVDINYSFEKGKIAYFGKISIKGNTKTRDKVIRRELRIYEGMMYSGSLLRKSKENVNRLGFFEQNSVIFNTVSPRGKDDILDVEISIKERQTGQISVGAGYSTATKEFFQASIAQNNFMGKGQNLNFNVNHSKQQKSYNLGFTEPYFLDTLWTAGGDIYSNSNGLTTSFSSKKYGADVRVGYPIFEYTRAFLTLRHEYTDLEDVANPTVDVDIENGVAATLKAAIRYDRRNNIFEPTDGYYGSLSFEYAGLYGDQEWLKGIFETRFYQPLTQDKELIFRHRLQMQQLMKTTDRKLPRTEKFSMGGARNMRGYNFEDIGPQVYDKDKITEQTALFNNGGNLSLLSSFELEHPLIKEAGLKWVLFYDVGNVYESAGDIEEGVLRQDYGFGFRWFSPIGVLRFEFAYPIDPEEDKNQDGQKFHFDIGQLF